ncbi:MAG: class II aldolase/adducin family protein [Sulfolobales archaeon]
MLDLDIRREIVGVMRRMYMRALITSMSGNVSRRANDRRRFWITPSGADKYLLDPEDLSLVDIESGERVAGLQPSSEYRMHLEIYRSIDDAEAIVHAHPPYMIALAHALKEETLRRIIEEYSRDLYEVKYYIGGRVAILGRLEPGTEELARSVAEALYREKTSIAILKDHGVVAFDKNLYKALNKVEVVEDLSRIILHSILATSSLNKIL